MSILRYSFQPFSWRRRDFRRGRIPAKGPIIQSPERNEWLAFTYEDGEYLITREAGVGSYVEFGWGSHEEQCSPRWSRR